MSAKEDLKELAEQLSEQEFERLKLLKKVTRLVEDMDLSEVNDLPSLYRLEIKKALEENGNDRLAARIET